MTTPGSGSDRPRPDVRERLLGGRDRLGWWMLPLFVMVGLGGAVLAGSLAVVYYAQQVSQLESETREAREDLVGAADEVREAADDALEAIDEEVAAVREELARGLPLENALEVGVVRLEVDTRLEASSTGDRQGQQAEPASARGPVGAASTGRAGVERVDDADDPDDGEAPDDGDDPGDGDDEEDEPGDAPPQEPGDDEEQPDTGPPPSRQVPLQRAGTGFVAVTDGDTAFLVTSLGLLDDPRTEDRVPADVEVTVRLAGGATTASVHSWDERNDLLLLEAGIGNVEPLPWREQGDAMTPGDRLVAVGTTPDLAPVRLGAEVAAVTRRALVTSLPSLHLIDGGPVVDVDGNVVGVAVASHGAMGGDPLVVPIRRLCDQLMTTCPD